ncbi:endospore germination permease [Bacillus sp. DTU_2020_1000418_1_SI_GHA_SEK_038]|uniref:GerAB/ArcD/ProY family transporter n=1 Tax=Bacillus sp. DTU_2020_1000418_1_SI_GHA_SEK_038 TaxID=3077585 RepID=UPI0028E67C2C|nr:endospore germination permease [Bacillus sp. DTU_2020_1000418_1_SI_GHA_SEK_038]WNS73487.1 endospore germination permease [Bacillus sp. DTU_2020_1000418_1_SI_GHA_SEK_038]
MMLEKGKISVRQFRVLVIFFTIGTSILVTPAILASYARQDAWIAVIIGLGAGQLVIWLFTSIANLFPNLNFVQVNEKVFGKWLGKIISLLFLTMPFVYTVELLFYSGTFITVNLMPETPIEMLYIMTVFILVMAVRLGLETFSRTAEINIVVFILLFLILLFITPQLKIENIQPILENGIKPLLLPVLHLVDVSYFNAVVLLMIYPAYVNQPKDAQKSFFIGSLIGGLVVLVITLLSTMVLGVDTTIRNLYPGYALAKKINVGGFLQRIEAVIAFMWIMATYFKMLLYFYATCLGLAQVLNLKDYRPLTLPLAMIAVAFASFMIPNVVEQQNWDNGINLVFSLSVGGILPLMILIVAIIRKKLAIESSKNDM